MVYTDVAQKDLRRAVAAADGPRVALLFVLRAVLAQDHLRFVFSAALLRSWFDVLVVTN